MEAEAVRDLIVRELPGLLSRDPVVRELVTRLSQEFASRAETESRFDHVLDELRRTREAQEKKWEAQQHADAEYRAAQDKKWEAQDKKWEESTREIRQILDELRAQRVKHESSVSALGARWGLRSEQSFRNALAAILEKTFGVRVERYADFDAAGEVFNRPEQIELDVIIKNGMLILCELKSSVSQGDVFLFARKVAFYEKKHQREATRRMVISPMVDVKARKLAESLSFEVYTHSDEVAVEEPLRG